MRPCFDHYTLGEITTGRVEWFLKAERAVSYSRAKHSRAVLNRVFAFALRHDAMQRSPVEGTSPLAKPKNQIQALTLEQVQAIRAAASAWRTSPGAKGPSPTGRSSTTGRGKGTFRQDHPKTDASVRQVPVSVFAARVLRCRIASLGPVERERTIFANRGGGPLKSAQRSAYLR